jgi:ABC-2 type transport system permease protein
MILQALAAFFIRDLRRTISYRLAFMLDVGSVFFKAATFYFVAQMIGEAAGSHLAEYGGQYFPFVLVGIAFSSYQSVGLSSFAQSIRQEQFIGTLESVLSTPIRIPVFLAGSALWDFFYATVEIILYFVVAMTAFGMSFGSANVGGAVLAAVLTLTTFMGLGILSAAFVLRFKRGNPVTWLIASIGELFGGVFFPVAILPENFQKISEWIPMTHALVALRKTLLTGASLSDVSQQLIFLSVFTLLVWPVGILAFQWALRRSQADGSLGHY